MNKGVIRVKLSTWPLDKIFNFIGIYNRRKRIKKLFYNKLYYDTRELLRTDLKLQYNSFQSALTLQDKVYSLVKKMESYDISYLSTKDINYYYTFKDLLDSFKENIIDYKEVYSDDGLISGEQPHINPIFINEQIKLITNENEKMKNKI